MIWKRQMQYQHIIKLMQERESRANHMYLLQKQRDQGMAQSWSQLIPLGWATEKQTSGISEQHALATTKTACYDCFDQGWLYTSLTSLHPLLAPILVL